MNIHYKNYPTDYIDGLQNTGKRMKARCFWEYYNDVQNKEVNSISFYVKSWGLTSKGSVHKWVEEFKNEIQKFYDSHILLNNQHYTSVKKQSERKVNGKCTNEQPQSTTTPSVDKTERTASERQVNQALNININTNRASGLFDGFYFLYRQFNKYAGNKLECKQSFINVDDVSHKSLSIAAILYLKDQTIDKYVGAKKFLENKVYLNYLDLHMRVMVDSVWLDGIYDTEHEVFISGEDKYRLPATKLAEKIGKSEIEFLREAV